MFTMEDRAAPIRDKYSKLVTLLSKTDFGMVLNESVVQHAESSGSHDSPPDVQVSSTPSGGAVPQPMTVTLEAQPSVIPQSVSVQSDDPLSGVIIAAVRVMATSEIKVLRAACQYLGISQSGSKSKLWTRILGQLDKQRILAETQIATEALKFSERDAKSVRVAERPTS